MRIEWDTLSLMQWRDVFMRIPKINLLQSYAYAKAMCQVHFQNTHFGHIVDDSGQTLGLVQMQEVKLLGIIHRVFIDRGPLWLSEYDNADNQNRFWRLISDMYPKRLGRKRRFIPECDNNAVDMEGVGYTRKAEGYQTIWLDIRPDEADLSAGLHKKWRNMLRRALDEHLHIDCDDSHTSLSFLLSHYMLDRLDKGYAGASPKLIKALHGHQSDYEYGLIYSARTQKTGDPCAMIYVFVHGTSATYQIGWSNQIGRDARAHYALLWHAVQDLKTRGIEWLDLGGINPDMAEGVTRFKKGMGGATYQTIGIYT